MGRAAPSHSSVLDTLTGEGTGADPTRCIVCAAQSRFRSLGLRNVCSPGALERGRQRVVACGDVWIGIETA